MSESVDLVVEQKQSDVQLHPYTPNVEKDQVCDPNDKECVNRLVLAFGDCA